MQKMKLAYFLRGLGVGMVFVTVVMAVSMKENKTIVQKEMTKEQIIQKAKEYGMTEGIGMKVDQLLDATPNPEATEVQNQKKEKDRKEKAQENPSVETGATKKFEVFSGQTAAEVAKEIENQGLVDDAEQFHKFLNEEGYTTKLIAGKHKILIDSSYEQIAKQLCEYNK